MGDDDLDEAAATRLLAKLRDFAREQLDDRERAMLSFLLAPGVANVYAGDEVAGFAMEWRPTALPEALATALRADGIALDGPDDLP